MKISDLYKEYDKLQKKYGDKNLDSIYNGGEENNPNICFVFMNPTSKNVASSKEWKGIKSPWIGTKNIWDLFYEVDLLDKEIYEKIKLYKPNDWTYDFSNEVYNNVKKHKFFITNLAKCTMSDARSVSDKIYKEYLELLYKEIEIINPKVIVLFGNQVSSIVLNQKISVSLCRKKLFKYKIYDKEYNFYSVYYPVGNGRYNINKSIEDIKYIQELLKK